MSDFRVDHLRNTKVGDFHLLAVVVNDDVGRLNVPVDDTFPVSVVDSRGHLGHQPDHLLGPETPPVVQYVGDRLPVDELHRQKRDLLLGLADFK